MSENDALLKAIEIVKASAGSGNVAHTYLPELLEDLYTKIMDISKKIP